MWAVHGMQSTFKSSDVHETLYLGEVPTIRIAFSAILLWRSTCSTAAAMMSPVIINMNNLHQMFATSLIMFLQLATGQLISKANCQTEDFSEKRTNEFVFTIVWFSSKVTTLNSNFLMVYSSENVLFLYLHFTWLYG